MNTIETDAVRYALRILTVEPLMAESVTDYVPDMDKTLPPF
jgi:hypothetical protein